MVSLRKGNETTPQLIEFQGLIKFENIPFKYKSYTINN